MDRGPASSKCGCCNAPSQDYIRGLERRLDKALEALGKVRFYKLDKDTPEDVQTVAFELQAVAKEGMK